ncbi:MAG: ribose-5-phosphate isomerase RpiA [Actinomycetota bacterium]|nr:ribose-5-phosphate isomerase RpiA [Actinomycetota bacterium]
MSGKVEEQKKAAAFAAVDGYVKSGMSVGLGTGTTAFWVIRRIGELLAAGKLEEVRGIPTSERSAEQAREEGIPLVGLSEARPNLTIDGADEIDPNLALIKGRGGALLREKIVAAAGDGLVVVADSSKRVDTLGVGTLPVEVEPFGWETTLEALAALGSEPALRMKTGEPFVTDGGHYTVDCLFPSIEDPRALETEIKHIPGALECGLFVGLSRAAVISREDRVEILEA